MNQLMRSIEEVYKKHLRMYDQVYKNDELGLYAHGTRGEGGGGGGEGNIESPATDADAKVDADAGVDADADADEYVDAAPSAAPSAEVSKLQLDFMCLREEMEVMDPKSVDEHFDSGDESDDVMKSGTILGDEGREEIGKERNRNKFLDQKDRDFHSKLKAELARGVHDYRLLRCPVFNTHDNNDDGLDPTTYFRRPVRVFLPDLQCDEFPCSPCDCRRSDTPGIVYGFGVESAGFKRSMLPIFTFSREEDYYYLMSGRYRCTHCGHEFNADDPYCMLHYSEKVKLNIDFYLSDRFGVHHKVYKRIVDRFCSDGSEKIEKAFREESNDEYQSKMCQYLAFCAAHQARRNNSRDSYFSPVQTVQTTINFKAAKKIDSKTAERKSLRSKLEGESEKT